MAGSSETTTARPIKVAHFVHRYPPALGGAESYFERLSRWLVHSGDHVTVFTTNAIELQAFWSRAGATMPSSIVSESGVVVRRYPIVGQLRGRRWLMKPLSLLPHRTWQGLMMPCNPLSWTMWRDAGQTSERFDVIHATAFPYAFPLLCARRLARRQGIPFLLTPFLHTGDARDPADPTRRAYTSPALMRIARDADVVFAQTPGERDILATHGVLPERITVQGLGVDAQECTGGHRWEVRQRWQVSPEEIVVGHLANNSIEKGSVDLLRAAESLWAREEPFRLILAGPEMPNFQRFLANYRYRDRVIRLGPLTAQDKIHFFSGLDLFALPSYSDSFGLVLLEAWANGLPNLAYRAGGIGDVVRHEVDGLLAPCGDIERLTLHLQQLIHNEALRRKLGSVGQLRIHREFRWQDKLQTVRDAMARLIDQPTRAVVTSAT